MASRLYALVLSFAVILNLFEQAASDSCEVQEKSRFTDLFGSTETQILNTTSECSFACYVHPNCVAFEFMSNLNLCRFYTTSHFSGIHPRDSERITSNNTDSGFCSSLLKPGCTNQTSNATFASNSTFNESKTCYVRNSEASGANTLQYCVNEVNAGRTNIILIATIYVNLNANIFVDSPCATIAPSPDIAGRVVIDGSNKSIFRIHGSVSLMNLDFKNFRASGVIVESGSVSTEIINCRMYNNAEHGITVSENAEGTIIDSCHLTNNAMDGIYSNGTKTSVSSCVAHQNKRSGIMFGTGADSSSVVHTQTHANLYGIYTISSLSRVENVTSNSNTRGGIFTSGDLSSITDAVCNGNGFFGVRAAGSKSTLQNIRTFNTLSNGHGVIMSGDFIMATNIVSYQNRQNGVLSSGTGIYLKDVICFWNSFNGIEISGEASIIENVRCGTEDGMTPKPNRLHGVFVNGNDITLKGSSDINPSILSGNMAQGIICVKPGFRMIHTYVGTDLTGMSPMKNVFTGIWIQPGCDNAVIEECVASGNAWNGISVQALNATLQSVLVGIGKDGVKPVPNQLNGIIVRREGQSAKILGSSSKGYSIVAQNLNNGMLVQGAYMSMTGTKVLANKFNGVLLDFGADSAYISSIPEPVTISENGFGSSILYSGITSFADSVFISCSLGDNVTKTGNALHGLRVDKNAQYNTIGKVQNTDDCFIGFNGGDGIHIQGALTQVRSCIFRKNSYSGIFLDDTAANSTLQGTSEENIVISDSEEDGLVCDAPGTHIENVTVTNNKGHGIWIQKGATETNIHSVVVNLNKLNGIRIEAPKTTVSFSSIGIDTQLSFAGNNMYGIHVTSTATDSCVSAYTQIGSSGYLGLRRDAEMSLSCKNTVLVYSKSHPQYANELDMDACSRCSCQTNDTTLTIDCTKMYPAYDECTQYASLDSGEAPSICSALDFGDEFLNNLPSNVTDLLLSGVRIKTLDWTLISSLPNLQHLDLSYTTDLIPPGTLPVSAFPNIKSFCAQGSPLAGTCDDLGPLSKSCIIRSPIRQRRRVWRLRTLPQTTTVAPDVNTPRLCRPQVNNGYFCIDTIEENGNIVQEPNGTGFTPVKGKVTYESPVVLDESTYYHTIVVQDIESPILRPQDGDLAVRGEDYYRVSKFVSGKQMMPMDSIEFLMLIGPGDSNPEKNKSFVVQVKNEIDANCKDNTSYVDRLGRNCQFWSKYSDVCAFSTFLKVLGYMESDLAQIGRQCLLTCKSCTSAPQPPSTCKQNLTMTILGNDAISGTFTLTFPGQVTTRAQEETMSGTIINGSAEVLHDDYIQEPVFVQIPVTRFASTEGRVQLHWKVDVLSARARAVGSPGVVQFNSGEFKQSIDFLLDPRGSQLVHLRISLEKATALDYEPDQATIFGPGAFLDVTLVFGSLSSTTITTKTTIPSPSFLCPEEHCAAFTGSPQCIYVAESDDFKAMKPLYVCAPYIEGTNGCAEFFTPCRRVSFNPDGSIRGITMATATTTATTSATSSASSTQSLTLTSSVSSTQTSTLTMTASSSVTSSQTTTVTSSPQTTTETTTVCFDYKLDTIGTLVPWRFDAKSLTTPSTTTTMLQTTTVTTTEEPTTITTTAPPTTNTTEDPYIIDDDFFFPSDDDPYTSDDDFFPSDDDPFPTDDPFSTLDPYATFDPFSTAASATTFAYTPPDACSPDGPLQWFCPMSFMCVSLAGVCSGNEFCMLPGEDPDPTLCFALQTTASSPNGPTITQPTRKDTPPTTIGTTESTTVSSASTTTFSTIITTTTTSTTTTEEPFSCLPQLSLCASGDECIDENLWCNQERDCADGSDEMFCYTLPIDHPVNCSWFEEEPERCYYFGYLENELLISANVACCACEGGTLDSSDAVLNLTTTTFTTSSTSTTTVSTQSKTTSVVIVTQTTTATFTATTSVTSTNTMTITLSPTSTVTSTATSTQTSTQSSTPLPESAIRLFFNTNNMNQALQASLYNEINQFTDQIDLKSVQVQSISIERNNARIVLRGVDALPLQQRLENELRGCNFCVKDTNGIQCPSLVGTTNLCSNSPPRCSSVQCAQNLVCKPEMADVGHVCFCPSELICESTLTTGTTSPQAKTTKTTTMSVTSTTTMKMRMITLSEVTCPPGSNLRTDFVNEFVSNRELASRIASELQLSLDEQVAAFPNQLYSATLGNIDILTETVARGYLPITVEMEKDLNSTQMLNLSSFVVDGRLVCEKGVDTTSIPEISSQVSTTDIPDLVTVGSDSNQLFSMTENSTYLVIAIIAVVMLGILIIAKVVRSAKRKAQARKSAEITPVELEVIEEKIPAPVARSTQFGLTKYLDTLVQDGHRLTGDVEVPKIDLLEETTEAEFAESNL
eukprot:m.90286 g.90286  ORF g.90286 m.90286 type:complete len:2359 (+) comp13260_c0_seq2:81-7157(+)